LRHPTSAMFELVRSPLCYRLAPRHLAEGKEDLCGRAGPARVDGAKTQCGAWCSIYEQPSLSLAALTTVVGSLLTAPRTRPTVKVLQNGLAHDGSLVLSTTILYCSEVERCESAGLRVFVLPPPALPLLLAIDPRRSGLSVYGNGSKQIRILNPPCTSLSSSRAIGPARGVGCR
jgi:hypothetical protein